jgi:hypothetical protein
MKQPSTSGMAGEIPAIRVLWLVIFYDSSFRGDAQHRTPMRKCALWNLEIPGLVLRTIPE